MSCREVKNIQFRKALEKEGLSRMHLMQDNGFLWIYSDNENENFHDSAIYVNNFKDLDIEDWIEEIKEKIGQILEKYNINEKYGAIEDELFDIDKISNYIINNIKAKYKNVDENVQDFKSAININCENTNQIEILPYWINNIDIELRYFNTTTLKRTEAFVIPGKVTFDENNRLICEMCINTTYYDIKTSGLKDIYFNIELKSTLAHEFRHLYKLYLNKNNNIRTNKSNFSYNLASKLKLDTELPFKDLHTIANNIKRTFYYIDEDEIESFLQQYKLNLKDEILEFECIYGQVIDNYITTGKLNTKWLSSISNYSVYLFLYHFWKDIDKNISKDDMLELALLVQNLVIDNSKKISFLKCYKNEVYVLEFNKIKQNVIEILANVLHKMACIYFDTLTNIYEKKKAILDELKKQEMIEEIRKANRFRYFWKEKIKLPIKNLIQNLKNIFNINMNENKKWTDDVSTKWEPKDGLFLEKNPVTIVNYLLKHSKDYALAMRRLNFYMNRAGDELKNKTVLNKAKALLKKRGEKLKENLSFEDTILNAISEGLQNGLNEVAWKFDNKLCAMVPKEKRAEDDIHLMSLFPSHSCMIRLLLNRVLLNSVGNKQYAKDLWYDSQNHKLYSNKENSQTEEGEFFRTYILPRCGKPAGWIYL